jgi:hypothetical protein
MNKYFTVASDASRRRVPVTGWVIAQDREEAAFLATDGLACDWTRTADTDWPEVTHDRYRPNVFVVSNGRMTVNVTVTEST